MRSRSVADGNIARLQPNSVQRVGIGRTADIFDIFALVFGKSPDVFHHGAFPRAGSAFDYILFFAFQKITVKGNESVCRVRR